MAHRTFRIAAVAAMLMLGVASPAGATVSPPVAQPGGLGFDLLCAGLDAVGGLPFLHDQPVLARTVDRTDRADGSVDLLFVLTGPIPTPFVATDVLDCLFVDRNANGVLDTPSESMHGYVATGITIAGSGAARTITFGVHIPGAAGSTICDRVYGVGKRPTSSMFTRHSAVTDGGWAIFSTARSCTPPSPPADVPEASSPVLLSVIALMTGSVLISRRRRSGATA